MGTREENQRQMWVDEEFYKVLLGIKAKKMMEGQDKSLSKITKEIVNLDSFRSVEAELLGTDKKKNVRMNIRFDGFI